MKTKITHYTKHFLLSTITIGCLTAVCQAQQWKDVGSGHLGTGTAQYIGLAIDKADKPYVCFQDLKKNQRELLVKKYDGNSWVDISSTPLEHKIFWSTALEVDANNEPIVALEAGPTSRIYKHNNGWQQLDNNGLVAQGLWFNSLAIDKNNVPYFVSKDDPNSPGHRKMSVRKFEAGKWVFVGKRGFSDSIIAEAAIAFEEGSKPYVFYRDMGNGGHGIVKKFDGTSWVNVGAVDFTNGVPASLTIAIDSKNVPYVAYRNVDSQATVEVKMFNGTSWVKAGNIFDTTSKYVYKNVDLAISNDDSVFIAYKEKGSGKATVKKLHGNTWVTVGQAMFSDGEVNDLRLVLDSKNIPYVAYRDHANNNQIIIKKFHRSSSVNDITTTQSITVSPNPAHDYVQVSFANSSTGVVHVMNAQGAVVSTANVNGKNIQINTSALAAGTYFLRYTSNSKDATYSTKFIVQ